MPDQCPHINRRGYGRCILKKGHLPVNNGCGVHYQHEYNPPDPANFARRAMGTLDTFESCDAEGKRAY